MTTSELEAPLSPTIMRDAMSAVPTCVTVVSGNSSELPAAMVIGSFVSISLEPALVGFFVMLDSTSWPTLREQKHLGISVLAQSHLEMVREITRKAPSRFHSSKWIRGERGEMLLRGAVTHMTGSIHSVQRVGDHDFVTLSLSSISSDTDLRPLVFQAGRLQTLGD